MRSYATCANTMVMSEDINDLAARAAPSEDDALELCMVAAGKARISPPPPAPRAPQISRQWRQWLTTCMLLDPSPPEPPASLLPEPPAPEPPAA